MKIRLDPSPPSLPPSGVRILVVGLAPARKNPLGPALDASSRFGKVLDRIEARTGARFDRRTLLPAPLGRPEEGADFYPIAARSAADALDTAGGTGLVLVLGRGAARAMGLRAPLLAWSVWRDLPALVFPHPSGLNRWWNDRRNRARALRILLLAGRGRLAIPERIRTTITWRRAFGEVVEEQFRANARMMDLLR